MAMGPKTAIKGLHISWLHSFKCKPQDRSSVMSSIILRAVLSSMYAEKQQGISNIMGDTSAFLIYVPSFTQWESDARGTYFNVDPSKSLSRQAFSNGRS